MKEFKVKGWVKLVTGKIHNPLQYSIPVDQYETGKNKNAKKER